MKTASSSPRVTRASGSVSPADTARHLRRLAEQRQKKAALRSERFRLLLPDAAAVLRDRYHVKDVILFGSLVTGTCRDSSDVDIAVRGLPLALYFAALADLMVLFGSPVDLVRLEEAPESLHERILGEGEVL